MPEAYYVPDDLNLKSSIEWIKERYEGTPCLDCSGVFPWVAMDFDHRPEEQKTFTIASRGSCTISPSNIAKVEKEIAKCDIICSNCHRVRTNERANGS